MLQHAEESARTLTIEPSASGFQVHSAGRRRSRLSYVTAPHENLRISELTREHQQILCGFDFTRNSASISTSGVLDSVRVSPEVHRGCPCTAHDKAHFRRLEICVFAVFGLKHTTLSTWWICQSPLDDNTLSTLFIDPGIGFTAHRDPHPIIGQTGVDDPACIGRITASPTGAGMT